MAMKEETQDSIRPHFYLAALYDKEAALRIAAGKAREEDLKGDSFHIDPAASSIVCINERESLKGKGVTEVFMMRGGSGNAHMYILMECEALKELFRRHGCPVYEFDQQVEMSKQIMHELGEAKKVEGLER